MKKLWVWIFISAGILATWGVGFVSGGISVHHKVRRQIATEVAYEEVFSSLQLVTGRKTYLVVAEPEDGCGELKEPPSVALESVDGVGRARDQIQWIILMKDSDQCSWNSKMIRAKVKGYVGVIAFAGKSDDNLVALRKTDWNSLDGFHMNISVVNAEDATKLKNYTYPKPYTISVNKDFTWGDFITQIYDSLVDLKRNIFQWYKKKVLAPLNSAYEAASKIGWTTVCVAVGLISFGKWLQRKWEEVEYEERRERASRNNNSTYNGYNEASKTNGALQDLKDYRELFGVGADASKKEVESAYRKKSREYHEDWMKRKNFSKLEIEKRTEIFKTVFPKALDALLRACSK